ncbi:DNA-binding transcriptional regulator, LysR family [Cohnella sp. OV330]|uniref:LysR family transcriptional regulator n=1 Tax=Cohnella sp. OV330 TaxID=1855288 RepID=UPI0008E07468|nr:LysR family transcriptional regulator [Cohnella sp. OV330]SFB56191.1 DNA-binding transcriptional regulator, LysR family [Cohnella sp. OV330]
MDPKSLRAFHRIAALGSFRLAAEELNYAQSTVTMQIQRLEEDLGVVLFERTGGLRLTEEGRLLRERSLPLLQDMDRLRRSLTEMRNGEAGEVRLGATEPAVSCRLPALLRRFAERYPKIRVSIESASTPVLSERLLKGELDLALCAMPEHAEGLHFEQLYREPFAALLPADHPLASQAVVRLEELAAHRLLVTASNCPYRRKLELLLAGGAAPAAETMEIGSMTALASYVAMGLGVALVPRVLADEPPSGVASRPIEGTAVDMACGLLSRASESPLTPAGAKLYAALRDELAE